LPGSLKFSGFLSLNDSLYNYFLLACQCRWVRIFFCLLSISKFFSPNTSAPTSMSTAISFPRSDSVILCVWRLTTPMGIDCSLVEQVLQSATQIKPSSYHLFVIFLLSQSSQLIF